MIDKQFCMSSYLAFRYIEKEEILMNKSAKIRLVNTVC